MSDAVIAKLVERLEAVTKRLESIEGKVGGGGGGGGGAAAAAGDANESVQEFDALVAKYIPKFSSLSAELGADVDAHAKLFVAAVDMLRGTLMMAANAKKPSDAELGEALKPLSTAIAAVNEYRDSRRGHKLFDHLSTISEGVAALSWVAIAPTPGPFATQSRAGSEFYSNKLLRQFKGKDQKQLDWVAAFNGFLKDQEPFIKTHHRTGLAWTGSGSWKDFAPGAVSGGASSAGRKSTMDTAKAKPPAQVPAASGGGATGGRGGGGGALGAALFGELNKGGAVTAGLKKVDRSQMTHKNPELRKGGVVKAPAAAKKPVRRGVPSGTPKFALEGNKWIVEFQDGNQSIVIDKVELKHTIYIYGCYDTVVQIKGKCNQITMDSSKKTSVVSQSVVSGIDAVNLSSCQVQILGKCATVNIEKSSGMQVYLSKECLDAEIVTSKIDSVNISVPNDDGEFTEHAVPEQFKSTVVGNTLKTDTVRHE